MVTERPWRIGVSPAIEIYLLSDKHIPREVHILYSDNLRGERYTDHISKQIRTDYEKDGKPRFFRNLLPFEDPPAVVAKFLEKISAELTKIGQTEIEVPSPPVLILLPDYDGWEIYFCLPDEVEALRNIAWNEAAKQAKEAFEDAQQPFDNQQLIEFEPVQTA